MPLDGRRLLVWIASYLVGVVYAEPGHLACGVIPCLGKD